MKSSLFSLVIVITSLSVVAQSEEVITGYFDKDWNETIDPNTAAYYRTVQEAGRGYIVRDYFASGKVQMQAACSEYIPKLIHDGKIVCYYENGLVAQEGLYKDGMQIGEFVHYYDNGNVRKRLDYGDGTNVRHLQYYTPAGDELLTNGTGDVTDTDGLREPAYLSIRDYKVASSFQIGPGQDTVYTITPKPAEYPGGLQAMAKYLQQNVRYPAEARRMGTQGTVFVSFVVDKTGKLSDFKVVKGVSPECDAEAIRVMRGYPLWEPGTVQGKAVKSRFVQPIKFRLAGRPKRG